MISSSLLEQFSTQELLDCHNQFQQRNREMQRLIDDQSERQEVLVQQRDFLQSHAQQLITFLTRVENNSKKPEKSRVAIREIKEGLQKSIKRVRKPIFGDQPTQKKMSLVHQRSRIIHSSQPQAIRKVILSQEEGHYNRSILEEEERQEVHEEKEHKKEYKQDQEEERQIEDKEEKKQDKEDKGEEQKKEECIT